MLTSNEKARKTFAPLLVAAAAATAIALAPVASAGSGSDCNNDGPAAVCTRNGHAAIFATPNTYGNQQFMIAPGGSPFGSGPVPPLLAID